MEGAVKRPSFEERKKRKQEAAVAPPQQQQQEDQQPDEPAAGTAVAQPPAAKKPRRAQPAAKADPAAAAAAEAKHKWVRTVAVGGLTQETLAAAMQMARAAGEVEELIEAVPDGMASKYMLKRDGCSGEAFLAVYKTVKQATDAVTKLHGQTAGGGRGQGGKKGGKGAAAAGCRIWARQLSGDGLHHKRWRVIVRNLPFTVGAAVARLVQTLCMGLSSSSATSFPYLPCHWDWRPECTCHPFPTAPFSRTWCCGPPSRAADD